MSALSSEFCRQGCLFPGNTLCRGNSTASLSPQSGSVQARKGYQLSAQAQSLSFLPPAAESSVFAGTRGKAVPRAFFQHHKCKKNQHNSLVHQLWHSLRNHTVQYLILRFLQQLVQLWDERKKEKGKKRDTISPEFPSAPPFITSLEKSKLFILFHSFHSCLALLCQIEQIPKEWLRNTFSLSRPTIRVLLWMEGALFAWAKLHTSTKAIHSERQGKSLPHSLQIRTKKVQGKGSAPHSRKGCWYHEGGRGHVCAALREILTLAGLPLLWCRLWVNQV